MQILTKVNNLINSFRQKRKNNRTIPHNMSIGRGSYFGAECTFIARDGGKIEIGNYCSIANGVTIINANHNYKSVSTYPFSVLHSKVKKSKDRKVCNVLIGNDVWIGKGAIILKGVTISDGAIVGAGSVVTKSVPPYAIVAGNPAKIRKFRFTEDEINSLMKIRWWEWSDKVIKIRTDDFYLPINQFITKYL